MSGVAARYLVISLVALIWGNYISTVGEIN